MQKLETRNTYTPTNTSLVRSNCDSVIKHGQSDQVLQSLKTVSNNSEENKHQHTDGLNVIVYVLNKNNKPLMPCKPAKARHLLKQNKAKVVTRKPFTIQLLWDCEHNVQPVKLGIDAGYKNVGISATSDKKELFSGEVILRIDIPKKLQNRAMYRKTRRSRLWHREPRFNNRGIPKGWLAPSIQHKLDSHLRIVEKIKQLLPVTEVTVEVASFDIQKIKNPDIQGEEYQNGALKNFWNVREYVLHRDNHTCQHCKGKSGDKILQVHHVHGRKEGATDRPEEFLTVCKTCHDKHHKGISIIPDKKIHRFKPETFMTIVRWKLVNQLREMYGDIVHHTYGYITKTNRISMGIEKSHANDAFVIAGATSDIQRTLPYHFKQVRRNNRTLQTNRKGSKPPICRQRYKLQPNDLVRYNSKSCRVKSTSSYGKRVKIFDNVGNIIKLNVKKVELICYGKGIFG